MAKKAGFKQLENPALQFVSQMREAEMSGGQELTAPQEERHMEGTAGEEKTAPQAVDTPKKTSARKTDKKKILPPGYEQLLSDGLGPNKQERKSRRVNFMFQPSLYDALSRAAQALDMSANELCAQVLKKYLTDKGVMNA